MKRKLTTRNVHNGRPHDHCWLSVLPDLCERTLQTVLPELREYAMNLLLEDIEDFRIKYDEIGHRRLSRHTKGNIQRLEKMGMAGCKLAVAANSSKVDFESLRDLLVELLPFLWTNVLQEKALDTLRTEFEERLFGEKLEDVQGIVDEISSLGDEARSSSPRSQRRHSFSSSFSNNLNRFRERRLSLPTKWRASRVAPWCQ